MSSLFDMTFSKIITSRLVLGHYFYAGLGAWAFGNLSGLNGDSNENGKKVASNEGRGGELVFHPSPQTPAQPKTAFLFHCFICVVSDSCRSSNYQITLRSRSVFQNLERTMWLAKHGKGVLSSVEQAFVGRNEKRAPLKMPAWEATFLPFSLLSP